jgi:hypothetical protein
VPTIRTHDALFRFVFGEPEQMAELLRAALPASLHAEIDWSGLRAVDGTFVDHELRGQQADLLFLAPCAGEATLLYVVCEHKSAQDRFTSWQLARYVVRVVERWRRDHPGADELPPVIPLVVHHGSRRWREPRSPHQLVRLRGFGAAARRFVAAHQMRLPFHLFDLATLREAQVEALRLSAVADLTLRFLQFLRGRSPTDAARDIQRWQHLVAALLCHPRGREVLAALFSWWLASGAANSQTLRTVMTKIRDDNPPMRSLLDLVLEEGARLGAEQAREDGRLAGQRSLLEDQLQVRFGALPASFAERLATADAAALRTWGRRLLTAASVEHVFAD